MCMQKNKKVQFRFRPRSSAKFTADFLSSSSFSTLRPLHGNRFEAVAVLLPFQCSVVGRAASRRYGGKGKKEEERRDLGFDFHFSPHPDLFSMRAIG